MFWEHIENAKHFWMCIEQLDRDRWTITVANTPMIVFSPSNHIKLFQDENSEWRIIVVLTGINIFPVGKP
jgi:hypothetical protein